MLQLQETVEPDQKFPSARVMLPVAQKDLAASQPLILAKTPTRRIELLDFSAAKRHLNNHNATISKDKRTD